MEKGKGEQSWKALFLFFFPFVFFITPGIHFSYLPLRCFRLDDRPARVELPATRNGGIGRFDICSRLFFASLKQGFFSHVSFATKPILGNPRPAARGHVPRCSIPNARSLAFLPFLSSLFVIRNNAEYARGSVGLEFGL